MANGASGSPLDVLFLGTGTSAGVPMIGCKCRVCTGTDPRDKRMRCSVVVSYEGAKILIDVTPELRLQCVANNVDWIDAVIMTHAHADHLMGMDDLRRFNSIREGSLDVWMDEGTSTAVRRCFGYCFDFNPDPQLFRPKLIDRRIEAPFALFGRTWTPVPLLHGKGPVLGFRIGDFAYCTDASAIPDASWALLEGLEVLVLDALQPLPWKHPTHFTVEEALDVVARLKPRQTYFTHMSHQVMHAEVDPLLPAGVKLAYDGLRVALSS